MIRFENISKLYGENTVALDDVDFTIERGEFISIVGKSGAGKSTLLRLLTRETRPTKGRVLIEDLDISLIKDKNLPLLRRKIGVVFQDIKLLPDRTVGENVGYALEAIGESDEVISQEIPILLKLVGLHQKENSFPRQLSGGERQRVAIARALAPKPLLLLADEPTGNLDYENALEILDVLKRVNERGTTVLLATHARELVDQLNRRVILLKDGRIVSDVAEGKYQLKN